MRNGDVYVSVYFGCEIHSIAVDHTTGTLHLLTEDMVVLRMTEDEGDWRAENITADAQTAAVGRDLFMRSLTGDLDDDRPPEYGQQ